MIRPITQIALDWAIRCFGTEHVRDPRVRALRLAEEAVELCQAYRIPKGKMEDLITMVYSREAGDGYQEVGGVLMTATVFSAAIFQQDPEEVFNYELRRVLDKPAEHFAKRNREKLDLGMHVMPGAE